MLRTNAGKGRRILVSTATNAGIARAVADHLSLFDEVVTRDSRAKDKAGKGDDFEGRFGAAGFDYVGGAAGDLAILAAAHRGYLIGASRAAVSRARQLGDKVQVLSKRPSRLKALVKVLRPHQWAKNALVVVPLLLAPGRPTLHQLFAAAVAAISFSLCASAGYVFNDLLDVEADRAHKRSAAAPSPLAISPSSMGRLSSSPSSSPASVSRRSRCRLRSSACSAFTSWRP